VATKKIGVEMAVALAEITPQTNIAARISESAAMSMASFHTGRFPSEFHHLAVERVVRRSIAAGPHSHRDDVTGNSRCLIAHAISRSDVEVTCLALSSNHHTQRKHHDLRSGSEMNKSRPS
jgi:hypothetical protein